MMEIRPIRICNIKKCSYSEGYDGHGVLLYSAEVSTSIDGGKNYWHCGEGKYCKTIEEANEYRHNVEYSESGRVFEDYYARLAKDGRTRYNVICYLCSFPDINPDIMALALARSGVNIAYDDISISIAQNKANQARINNLLKKGGSQNGCNMKGRAHK